MVAGTSCRCMQARAGLMSRLIDFAIAGLNLKPQMTDFVVLTQTEGSQNRVDGCAQAEGEYSIA